MRSFLPEEDKLQKVSEIALCLGEWLLLLDCLILSSFCMWFLYVLLLVRENLCVHYRSFLVQSSKCNSCSFTILILFSSYKSLVLGECSSSEDKFRSFCKVISDFLCDLGHLCCCLIAKKEDTDDSCFPVEFNSAQS